MPGPPCAAPGALQGGNADALYNEGVILWNGGKIADAKAKFQAAIAANPNHAESHYQLGMSISIYVIIFHIDTSLVDLINCTIIIRETIFAYLLSHWNKLMRIFLHSL